MSALPTKDCLPEMHEYQGGCFHCCGSCNYDTHRCPACGQDLRHDMREYGGRRHPCLEPACPECEQGKHANCAGFAFDAADMERECACECRRHEGESNAEGSTHA